MQGSCATLATGGSHATGTRKADKGAYRWGTSSPVYNFAAAAAAAEEARVKPAGGPSAEPTLDQAAAASPAVAASPAAPEFNANLAPHQAAPTAAATFGAGTRLK